MDSKNVKEDIDRLVKGFTSLDSNEFDSVIHEFFKHDASIDNSALKIKGASRIRDFTALQATIADSNQVVGKPSYDDKHKIVNFEFKRKFKSIPVVSSFLGSAWNCQAQIHLESQGSDAGKMYVSRVNVKERPHASVVNATFYYFLRPFFSLLAIFISQVSVFYHNHAKDSWPQFIISGIQALVFGIWNVVMREQSHVRGNAGKWREAKGEELKKMIEQAKSTAANVADRENLNKIIDQAKTTAASVTDRHNLGKIIDSAKTTALDVTNNVELRARNAGVPVDQYKKQAGEIASDLQKRVQEATGYVQDQAGKAKKQAGETAQEAQKQAGDVAGEAKKQLNGAKDEAKKQAGNAKDQAEQTANKAKDEAKKQAGNAKDQAEQTASKAKDEANKAKDGAKKQAGSTKEQAEQTLDNYKEQAKKSTESNGNAQNQKKGEKKQSNDNQSQTNASKDVFKNDNVDPDEVPTTPLGGHDPTAPNAFSYAHAAEL